MRLTKKKRNYLILTLFLLFVFLFLWTSPNFDNSGTIKIWDRNNILLYEVAGSTGKKIPITIDKFPKNLINAAISSEDETFWSNPGVDFKAIIRAAFTNITQRKIVSGASTITQQLARASIISPQKLSNPSFIRKFREILMALRISYSYSKQDIITKYLNQMYFGNLSYGVQSASTTYFNKDASNLSLAESAFLVGLISSPVSRNPFVNFNLAKERQLQVLDLMVKDKYISKEQSIAAKNEKLTLVENQDIIKAPHFVKYVEDEIVNLGIKNNEGINVYTTLDYPTFTLSNEIAKIWINKLKDKHDLSNAALVLINNSTGEILDMLGGIDYFDASHSGQVNMTTVLRQPGSALKPVTYAAAFMQGETPATLIYDIPKVYLTKKGEGYTPNNYDGQYHGLVLARQALASSLNLPAVEMLNRIGIPNFLSTAHKLGITTLNDTQRYDLSLTLGGGEVKLLDLTNVYASFARGGVYKTPYAIEKITTDDQKLIYEHPKDQGVQALGNNGVQVSYLISDILSDPQARLLGFYEKNPLVLSRPAAVKTGTTTDWHDNWTVGYTPEFTVGVWVGNNDNKAMREITGVVGAAPIWNQFFEEYLKGKPVEKFIRPDRISTVNICKLTGLLPDELCQDRLNEIFINGSQPKTVNSVYKKVKIDVRNNLLANSTCPQEFVKEEILINYPPQVYSWAISNNQNAIPTQYSPLCDKANVLSGQSYIELIYPRAKTVFENAPDSITNQGIVFEVNVSSNIEKVQWFLNGKILGTSTKFPYSYSWYPSAGKYNLEALGITGDETKINSKTVPFSVISNTN